MSFFSIRRSTSCMAIVSRFSKKQMLRSSFLLGRRSKSFDAAKELIEKLMEIGFKRNHRLIAVGGGIIQDAVAFVASILFRGVQWIFVPTTLLSQGDSCIGSKTSVNFGNCKNLLGGFSPAFQDLYRFCFSCYLG